MLSYRHGGKGSNPKTRFHGTEKNEIDSLSHDVGAMFGMIIFIHIQPTVTGKDIPRLQVIYQV
jgi:hypothetical protein